jgi:hypothetical protein
VESFIEKRHLTLRRLAQADHNFGWFSGIIPAVLTFDDRRDPKQQVSWEGDLLAPPGRSLRSNRVRKMILFDARSTAAVVEVLPDPKSFPNLTKLIITSFTAADQANNLDLSRLSTLTHLQISSGLPPISAIPASLSHVSLDAIRTGSLPRFMDMLFQMLWDSQRALDFLSISACDAGPAISPRGYVGHLIKHLSLNQIYESGWVGMLTPTAVPATWFEALVPPNLGCKSPRLIRCCLGLVSLFPNSYIGSYNDNTPFNLRTLPLVPRHVDKLLWPAQLMVAAISNPSFSSLRMLEVRHPVADEANTSPEWLRDIDSSLPALQFLRIQMQNAKSTPNIFNHRGLTSLVIHRPSTKPFALDGAGLPSLRIFRLIGVCSAEVAISNFQSLQHATVGTIAASFVCSGVPQLLTLAVTGSEGSMRLDAPNLRILSLEATWDKIRFVSTPTLLQSLTFWIPPRSWEPALRVLKDLKKLAGLANLLNLQIIFGTADYHGMKQHEQRDLSDKVISSLTKAICGSSGGKLAELFAYFPKLGSVRVGRRLCVPGPWECDQAAQKFETDPAGSRPSKLLLECVLFDT